MVPQSHLGLHFQGIQDSSGISSHCLHVMNTYTCRQDTHTREVDINKYLYKKEYKTGGGLVQRHESPREWLCWQLSLRESGDHNIAVNSTVRYFQPSSQWPD